MLNSLFAPSTLEISQLTFKRTPSKTDYSHLKLFDKIARVIFWFALVSATWSLLSLSDNFYREPPFGHIPGNGEKRLMAVMKAEVFQVRRYIPQRGHDQQCLFHTPQHT